jgi:predicted aspartyl protease
MVWFFMLGCSFRPAVPPLASAYTSPDPAALASCPSATARTFPIEQVVEVPMRLDRVTGLPTVEVVVEGRPARFLVDTGAGANVLSRRVVERLGLDVRVAGAVGTAGGEVGSGRASATLQLGTLRIDDPEIVVLDRSHLRSVLLGTTLVEFDGILGWPVLGAGRTTLDYGAERLRLEPSAAPTADERVGPMVWQDAPVASAMVGGRARPVLLDTGATLTVMEQGEDDPLPVEDGRPRKMNGGPGAPPVPFRRTTGPVEIHALGLGRVYGRLDVTEIPTGPSGNCARGALGSDFFAGRVLVVDGVRGTAGIQP